MSDEWVSIVEFDSTSFESKVLPINTAGSGETPVIDFAPNYLLMTEDGQVLQYETGEEISLEVI